MLPLFPLIKSLIRWQFPRVRRLSTEELASWLNQDDRSNRPLLLDARSSAEYRVSHLKNAVWVPELNGESDLDRWWQAEGRQLERQLEQQTGAIVVYCSVGYRSARLADRLQELGGDRVFNLEGSIFEWANRGYPVYRGEGAAAEQVRQVHPYSVVWGLLLRPELRAGEGEREENC